MKWCVSILLAVVLWAVVSWLAGPALFPSPWETAGAMARLLATAESWKHILITFFRGTAGLFLALAAAFLIGIPCGLNRTAMNLLSPLIAVMQACPVIVWVSLLMVWVGVGSMVPIAAIWASVFPVLFLNVAQGVAALDERLFVMARVYRVGRWRMLRQLILPGISAPVVAGFSYALGVCWKVTATAEFIGSSSGIGSRIYWSYRFLDMPQLFCWALILIAFGLALEAGWVRPLRDRVRNAKKSSHD